MRTAALNPYKRKIDLALTGLKYAGGPLISGAYAGYNYLKRRRKSNKKQKYKGSGKVSYIPEGSAFGKKVVGKRKTRRRRKKKSLRKKVNLLLKNKPKDAVKTVRWLTPVILNTGITSRDFHWVSLHAGDDLKTELASVDTGPSTVSVSGNDANRVKVRGRWSKLHFRNARTSPATIQIVYIMCKQDVGTSARNFTNNAAGPLNDLHQGWTAKGLNTKTVTNGTANGATQALVPAKITLGSSDFFYNLSDSAEVKSNWKVLGSKKIRVKGGDELIDTCSFGDIIYKGTDFVDTHTYYKNYDIGALIITEGVLCHDSTNNNLIGYSPATFDCHFQSKYEIVISGAGGTHKIDYTDLNQTTVAAAHYAQDDIVIGVSDR
jgi:hypothetical protein